MLAADQDNGVADAPAPEATRRRPTSLPGTVIAGALLLTAYFVIRQLLPSTGRSEFAYAPFTAEFHLFAPMRGFTVEQLVSHVLRVVVLGPALLLLSFGLARVLQLEPLKYAALARRLHVWLGACSIAVTAYVMCFVLRGRAIIDDEVTYAEMARTFSRGALAEPAIRGATLDFFEVVTKVGVTGKYLFGEPLVQMVGVLVGVPALLHLVLNAITLGALYRSVQVFWSDRALSACSCALLALSPTFMLCAATGLSQATSLTCVALSIWGYALAARRAQPWGGVFAGLAVAFGFTVRVQTMAPVALVLGCAFLVLAYRTRRLGALFGFVGASLLGAVAVGAYNHALTGNPLTLPWFLQDPETTEHYGFGRVWSGSEFTHTPLGALQNLLVVGVRMNSWWLGWPLALLLVFQRGPLRRVFTDAPIFVAVSLAIIVFELGYYSTGVSDVGPIYHFELLLGLSVVAAHFVTDLLRKRPELAVAGLVVHVLLGTGSFVYEESARLERLASSVHRGPERVLALLPENSLLLYEHSCSDVIAVGWMMRPFAQMTHDPRARTVTYGRPHPATLDSFVRRFGDRSCFYLDRSQQGQLQVSDCKAARARLMRPFVKDRNQLRCAYIASTAQRLGWLERADAKAPESERAER